LASNTPKLGLYKKDPVVDGNDTFNIQTMMNDNWDKIDTLAALEQFPIKSLSYDSGNNRIAITFGPGLAELFDGNDARAFVQKDNDTIYYIDAPAINTTYYVYIQADGTFAHNTSGIIPANAALLWNVTTGAELTTLTALDRRAILSATGARLAAHLAETAQTDDVHGLKTLFQNQQFVNLFKNGDFASWSAGDTAAPDGWRLLNNATVAKSTNAKVGQYSAEITGDGTYAPLIEARIGVADTGQGWLLSDFDGKTVTACAFVKTTDTTTQLSIWDDDGTGATSSGSNYHSGSGDWELLTVTRTLRTGLTDFIVRLSFSTATAVFNVDSVILVFGELPVAFANHPNDQHLKAVDYQDSAGANYEYGLLKMQCGKVNLTSDTAGTAVTKTVTLPVTFTKLLAVSLIHTETINLGGKRVIPYTYNWTNGSFVVGAGTADLTTFASVETKGFSWVAVGVG